MSKKERVVSGFVTPQQVEVKRLEGKGKMVLQCCSFAVLQSKEGEVEEVGVPRRDYSTSPAGHAHGQRCSRQNRGNSGQNEVWLDSGFNFYYMKDDSSLRIDNGGMLTHCRKRTR